MSQRTSALFLDIGGVLLTKGWDRHARRRVAEAFGLDPAEMNERHLLTFDTYEAGKLSLDTYLERTFSYREPMVVPAVLRHDVCLSSPAPTPARTRVEGERIKTR